jgi:hypothetical protein
LPEIADVCVRVLVGSRRLFESAPFLRRLLCPARNVAEWLQNPIHGLFANIGHIPVRHLVRLHAIAHTTT